MNHVRSGVSKYCNGTNGALRAFYDALRVPYALVLGRHVRWRLGAKRGNPGFL